MSLDATKVSDLIRERLVDFVIANFDLADEAVNGALRDFLGDKDPAVGLVGNVFVEPLRPAQLSDMNLPELVAKGQFPPALRDQLERGGAFPADRALYRHQLAALDATANGKTPALVVTSGTGTGKTEAFLLPALRRLYDKQRDGRPGMRVLVLYPMNALVEDQLGRLDIWLGEQRDYSFFAFTGMTPETDAEARRRLGFRAVQGRIDSREKARALASEGKGPDVVVTNYSMLEYMLCRPVDEGFFGTALDVVVFDEVHGYRGARGAELAMLLRRVFERCGKRPEDVLFLSASATVGGGTSEHLKEFLAGLSSRSIADVVHVEGIPVLPVKGPLAPSPEDHVSRVLDLERQEDPVALRRELPTLKPFHLLVDAFAGDTALPLNELASRVVPNADVAALEALLRSAARRDDDLPPLFAHRLYLLSRSPDDIAVCVNPSCGGKHKLPGFGALTMGEGVRCHHCHGVTVPLRRCECGTPMLADTPRGGQPNAAVQPRFFALDSTVRGVPVSVDYSAGAFDTDDDSSTIVQLKQLVTCPGCACDLAVAETRALAVTADLCGLVALETTLTALPPLDHPNARALPAEGRRMLVFSDSRRAAALLGPSLQSMHERFAFQKLAVSGLARTSALAPKMRSQLEQMRRERSEGSLTERDRDWLEDLESRARAFVSVENSDKWLTDGATIQAIFPPIASSEDEVVSEEEARNRLLRTVPKRLAAELARYDHRGNQLEALGQLRVEYPGLERLDSPTFRSQELVGLFDAVWPEVLALLLDTLRVEGATEFQQDDGDDFQPEHTRRPIVQGATNGHPTATSFCGSEDRHRRRRLVRDLLHAWRVTANDSRMRDLVDEVLDHAWNALVSLEVPWRSGVDPDDILEAWRVKVDRVSVRIPDGLFYSPSRRILVPRALRGVSIDGADFAPIELEQLRHHPRIGRWLREWNERNVFDMALWAEEHSAQIDTAALSRRQARFRAGRLNVLSATTTMELGVDIGGLVAVFLSNVPPSRASFVQRVGRAGRRGDGSSLAVIQVQPRPFDRFVYQHFDEFLSRVGNPMRIDFGRERLAWRQVQAFLFSEFMRRKGTRESGGAMRAFGVMGAKRASSISFTGEFLPEFWDDPEGPKPAVPGRAPNPPIDRWRAFLGTEAVQDDALRDAASRIAAHPAVAKVLAESWQASLTQILDGFNDAVRSWVDDTMSFREAYDGLGDAKEVRPTAIALREAWSRLVDAFVIEYLAEAGFLPRYGFPVGVQRLQVQRVVPRRRANGSDNDSNRLAGDDRLRLQRSALMALSEYVPGSKVIVDGNLVHSRGVLKVWSNAGTEPGEGFRGSLVSCEKGHRAYSLGANALGECPLCQGKIARTEMLLFPRFGYVTDPHETPQRLRRPVPVGTAERMSTDFTSRDGCEVADDWAGTIGVSALYREQASILGTNRGKNELGFALCYSCGYADSEAMIAKSGTDADGLPDGFSGHRAINRAKRIRCMSGNRFSGRRNVVFGARLVTDAIAIEWPAQLLQGIPTETFATTMAYALAFAAEEAFELEPNSFGVLTSNTSTGFLSVLFDDAAGGVGYARQVFENGSDLLDLAIRKYLRGNVIHDRDCQGYCLDCLLTFGSQFAARRMMLDRRVALAGLARLNVPIVGIN